MIFGISKKGIGKRLFVALRVIILGLLLLYIVPNLLLLLWQISHPAPKLHHDEFLEKPLRVSFCRIG